MVEVFGIPIIASSKFENSDKLNHVASIMAELLDQDGDGCADDPNVLRSILTKVTKYDFAKWICNKSPNDGNDGKRIFSCPESKFWRDQT